MTAAQWVSGSPLGIAPTRRNSIIAVALLALGCVALLPASRLGLAVSGPAAPAAEERALDAYGNLPLAFVPNLGQTDPRVRFSAQAGGASFQFTDEAALVTLAKGEQGVSLRLAFLGANPAPTIEGARPGPGRVNYLIGNDPAEWHTGLPTYGQVVYRELWPGIDMVFRGGAGQLKYEFLVRPGARPADIRLAYGGASGLSVNGAGELLVQTPLGALRDERPRSYQEMDGRKVPVASRFALGAGSAYGFALGGYDGSQPLVIDPGLVYSTFLGGINLDEGSGIAVDATGAAYVTGRTGSPSFPTTPGAFDTTHNGNDDVFVTKLNAAGSGLVYSTFVGGSVADMGKAIAVDATGAAYLTGITASANFPTTPLAADTTHNGGEDVFVTKLNSTGSALLYSTFLGGSGMDQGWGIAVDAAGGAAYVTGLASAGFPTSTLLGPGGGSDAFVSKLDATGSALVYSTRLGGTGTDQGYGIAVDASGAAHVTGVTVSPAFPTTPGAFDTSHNGGFDAFMSKLNAAGSGLLYSTFLGGSGNDQGRGIRVDAPGAAYLTGHTSSTNFPITTGAYDTSYNGSDDAFVSKLNPTPVGAASLLYSTYLGGSLSDLGLGIGVDAGGAAYVTGQTRSTDFPTTTGAFDTSHNGGTDDAFMSKLDATGSMLSYSTYLGGSGLDRGFAIAVDAAGAAYLAGLTASANFPTTAGAYDTSFNGGGGDAFVSKLETGPGAPATLTLEPVAATNTVGDEHCVTATVEDAAGNPVPNVTVYFSVTSVPPNNATPASGSAATDANGEAEFCYSVSLPGEDMIHAFADTNGDGDQDTPPEPFGDATKAWILPTSTAFCQVTITNGGWIIANNGDRASFGGVAKVSADGSTVQGQQQYQDHGPVQPLNVHSIELTATTCSDDLKSATIFGTATIDGSGVHVFRIDVTDMGKSGKNDTYGIILDTGYMSGQQQLQGGNVTIHKN